MKIKEFIKRKPIVAASIFTGSIIIIITLILLANNMLSKKTAVVYNPGNTSAPTAVQDAKITKIEPIDYDATGVSLKSEFKLLCDRECDASKIKALVNVTPSQDFNISKVSDKEFRLSFVDGLKSNSIYKFETGNLEKTNKNSWAFQTRKTFKAVRTLPRDKATSVPLNSGIEITFSHENFENLDKYFDIEPKVKGRFEYHGKTVVFVPEKLEEGTIYTVTVRKGLPLKDSEEKTEQDFVFMFQTESKKINTSVDFNFSERFYNFTAKVAPTLQVYTDDENKDADVGIDVFKYQSEDEFDKNLRKFQNIPYWASIDENKFKYDSGNLVKVSSTKARIQVNDENNNNIKFICFPSALPEGHYLIKLTLKGSAYWTLMQVNNASTFISVGKDKTLVWVNDAGTGNPIEGAAVKVEGKDIVKTDKDGIAQIQGKISLLKDSTYYNFKVGIDKKPSFFAAVRIGYTYQENNTEENTSDIYWTYLYMDRGMYLPTDTVRIWGVVKPREKGTLPDNAVLQLFKNEYSYFEENELPLLESKKIKLTTSGTFKDAVDLKNLDPGFYSIRLKFGDQVITEKGFEVKEYTKPAYKIDIKPDKNAVYSREQVKFDIQSSFFEGSPVMGIKLKYFYDYSGGGKEGTINCGDDGHGSLTVLPQVNSESWQPVNLHLHVSNSQAEEEEIYSTSDVSLFPRDTMLEVNAEKDGNKGVVEVKSSLIDISRIKGKDGSYYSPDDYRGNPVDRKLTAKVFEKHWERKETGEYYDFINKREEKKYEYYEVENQINQLNFTTTGGKYKFEFPLLDENSYYRQYYVEINGYDSKQRIIKEKAYIYSNYYDYNVENRDYNLIEESGKNYFKSGDRINLKLKHGTEDIKPGTNCRTLFMIQKNGILSSNVSTDLKYSFQMDKNYVPNVYVQAVYFDGTNVFDAGSKMISYDFLEKELKIDVKADKYEYKPGDTANIEIEVKDDKGKPCMTEVNLSVVDEAFFAVQDQSVDTLRDLYETSVSSGEIVSYVSYQPINTNPFGGAENGEGGDEGVRALFKDNAFFDSVVTDKEGKAKVSFKLPDNLTSWRITYQGITEDLKAGSGKTNIAVKLPFFVDVIFNNIFLENDSPYITARTYGTELKSGDNASYEVELENKDGLKKTFTALGKANLFTHIALGSLPQGDYSVTVKAKCKSYNDTIKKEFKTVKNILEAGKTDIYKLSEGLKINGGKSLTTLEFYNKDASLFYEALNSLAYTWGERVDQKLSRKIAADLLKKYYKEDDYWLGDEEFDFSRYQLDDGGIGLLKYDSSDPELSAKMCSLAKDEFDKSMLTLYFYNIVNKKESTMEDVVSAYWGLAALNEPVLIDVKNLIGSSDIKLKEKLHLILALAELGDFETAKNEYDKAIGSSMKRIDPMAYIDAGPKKDDIIEATSICSIIALKLGVPEKTAFFNYVMENSAQDLLTNFEQMVYVADSIPDTQQEGKFIYELDGKKTEVTLNKAEKYRLALTAEKLSGIKFSDIKGDIAVLSSYKGPIKDSLQANSNLVKLKRVYSTGNKKSNTFKQSDFITINLIPEFSEAAPDGYYEITDVLPCGLRYVEGRPYVDTRYYPDEVSGQKVVFSIYYSKKSNEKLKNVTYFARAVSPGEFTADNAIIKHFNSDTAGFAGETKIIIQK